jgi:hypothetical protein
MRRVRVQIPNSAQSFFRVILSGVCGVEGSEPALSILEGRSDAPNLALSGRGRRSSSMRRVRVQIPNSASLIFCHPEQSEGSRRTFRRPASVTQTSSRARTCRSHAVRIFTSTCPRRGRRDSYRDGKGAMPRDFTIASFFVSSRPESAERRDPGFRPRANATSLIA